LYRIDAEQLPSVITLSVLVGSLTSCNLHTAPFHHRAWHQASENHDAECRWL